jgi:hypothetical protein
MFEPCPSDAGFTHSRWIHAVPPSPGVELGNWALADSYSYVVRHFPYHVQYHVTGYHVPCRECGTVHTTYGSGPRSSGVGVKGTKGNTKDLNPA